MNEVNKNANMSKEIRGNQDENKDSHTNEKKWDFKGDLKTSSE